MPSYASIDDQRLDAFVSLSRPAAGQLQNIDHDPNNARTAAIITVYIALSASVDMYNRFIWRTLEFPYPVFLVTSQLVVTALGSTVFLQLVDSADNTRMSRGIFMRSIIHIGILFSSSLFLSNQAYLHLSVSWIQMLRAFVPVTLLLVSGIPSKPKNFKVFAIVLMISFGGAVASHTSAYALRIFDMLGFGMQALAVMFEASRLVMLEILLHSTKIHPLVALQYSASVCAVFNLIVLAFTEGLDPLKFLAPVAVVLLGNALLAFGMNIAAMYLIDVTSGLVLTLAGVLKDMILFTSSALMFGERISGVQVVGYSIALGGLVLYRTVK